MNNYENARYIEVAAEVRYWEDAELDGIQDEDGLIPLRRGDNWCPVIELATGRVLGWPEGTEADIHYKVCDQGEYWLLDEAKARIAKWTDYYVPNAFLCHGDNGYGDYIIFKIGGDGLIAEWRAPDVDPEQWAAASSATKTEGKAKADGAEAVDPGQVQTIAERIRNTPGIQSGGANG